MFETRIPKATQVPIGPAAWEAWSPRERCQRLERCGFTPRQAADLTARLEGLGRVRSGWSLDEIEDLLFLRWLVQRERIGDAGAASGSVVPAT